LFSLITKALVDISVANHLFIQFGLLASTEVFQQFADAGFEMSRIARKYAKWHIDLPLCNRLQLEGVGVTDVRLSGICTYQQCNDYFSARRLGINSGRIFTGVLLR
jgi:copper oxidase (laccase) domain-containing protein